MRRSDLLVRGDILKLRHLLHRRLDDRRPMIELFYVRVGQRVLIERAAQAPADAYVLPGLHEEFGPFDRSYFGPQALDDLVGREVALIMRLQLNKYAGSILRRVVRAGPGKAEDAGDRGILSNNVDDLVGDVDHRRKRYVLARLGLAEYETCVLLWEKTLRDRDIEVSGHRDQHQGRQEGHELVAKDEDETPVVAV